MDFAKSWQKLSFILVCFFVFETIVFAQQTSPQRSNEPKASVANPNSAQTDGKRKTSPDAEKIEQKKPSEPVSAQAGAKTIQNSSSQASLSEEEAAILPVYNNYLEKYVLGPEDIISVEVFGQPNYSKAGIVVPPTARISYPLIPGGIFVGGKTTEQISEEIKKKLDEFIIDPRVTVTLDKVGSARFSVLGKVIVPGVKVMNRRYNIYEAVAEAGGIAKEGDKKRVVLMRLNPQGGFSQTIIDFDKVIKGKSEVPYLVPGDQIIVPEKRWSTAKIINIIGSASAFRILFGSPF